MAKKHDLKSDQKRKKRLVIIGGVLLLALLAFQVPRTMKMLHPKPLIDANGNALGKDGKPIAPVAAPPAGTVVPLAAPTLAGATQATDPSAVTGATAGALVDTSAAPEAAQSQLASFGRFASKDPFHQQVTEAGVCDKDPVGAASPCVPAAKAPTLPGQKAAPTVTLSTAPGGVSVPSAPPLPAVPPTSAEITVNGVVEPVALDKDFPAASPVFHLVSLTATTAKIAIAGGSYANGSPTVTLKKGKPLTLMNTADGTRYVLQLVSTGTTLVTAPAATPPAPVAPTTPPAAPASATPPPSIGTPTPAGR